MTRSTNATTPSGTSAKLLVLLAGALLLLTRAAAAQEPADTPGAGALDAALGASPSPSANPARALLDEINHLDDTTRRWTDRTQRLKLLIVDGRGTERQRELRMKTLKRDGGEDKTITVFFAPPEVRGTSFLQFAHKDRDAEQWLWLPALNRVRQISAQSKNESFVGTDFSYRDLELLTDVFEWTEAEATSRLVGNEQIEGRDAAIIELEPKKKDVGYRRIRLAITTPDKVLRRMEFWAGQGSAPKKLLHLDDIRDVNGIPTAFRLEMLQPAAGSRTLVEVLDVRYDQGLSEDEFTQRALERGALDDE
ncbi:MAG TPA: outer membrane lipoprotein-sorting protein [Candidatus Binatia bacterium]